MIVCICIYSCACYLSVVSQRAASKLLHTGKRDEEKITSEFEMSGEWRVAVTENDGGI